jgi:hypothetical protein
MTTMGVKKITKEQYDEAVDKVMMREIFELEGSSKILIPMVGMIFAKKISNELFGESEEN